MAIRKTHGGGSGVRCHILAATVIVVGGFGVLGLTFSACGEQIEGVVFAKTFRRGETRMRLVGVGLQRYLYFYKVNVGACYIGQGHTPEKVLNDIPKRLELEYFHKIKAKDFAFLTEKYARANMSPREYEAIAARIRRLNDLYENVKPGDRYALTYLPGRGTELALNGAAKGTIKGADFARAVFAIWLGEHPISASLRDALLGRK